MHRERVSNVEENSKQSLTYFLKKEMRLDLLFKHKDFILCTNKPGS